MSRKSLLYFLLAALVAAAAVIGVVATRAQGSAKLPSIAPATLLAKVAAAARTPTPVSGSITWTNGLIPGSDLTNLFGGQGAAPSSLAGLALGGSGRLWVQPGAGARLDVQGNGSDFVVVGGKGGVWTYSSATNTAVDYSLPSGRAAATASPSPAASAVDPLAAITSGLQRFASTGTVAVSGQQTVAGQESYLLTVTPASGAQTTFGSVQVAVDGSTFVPLQVQVFARGDSTPVLSAGFTKVSYAKNATSLFSFTPPAGATVQHKALPAPTSAIGRHDHGAGFARARQSHAGAGAGEGHVIRPDPGGAGRGRPHCRSQARWSLPGGGGRGASAVLRYGRGFGSVVLAESSGATGLSAA